MANTHSKASEEAMKDADRHATDGGNAANAIPGGEHARSETAHLGGGKAHTKAVGDLRELETKEESNRDNGRATETYRNA